MSDELLYLILFLGFSLTGFIFIGVALHTKKYQRKKELAEYAYVAAKIADCIEKQHRSGRYGTVRYYVPVIAFTADHTEYRLENENGYRERDKIEIGKPVDVMYDPNDPAHFHLTEDDANDKASESLLRFGLIIVIGAAILTVVCYIGHVF